jgi:hypothetical protein
MDIYYVYMYLRDKDTKNGPKGSPYYIGKGKNNRAYEPHMRIKANFRPKDKSRIRFIKENLSEDDAYMWEAFWIAEFGRIDLGTGCLRNLTDGGEGNKGISDKSRKQKQEWMLNPSNNPMYNASSVEKLKKTLTGRTQTEETKAKISNTLKGFVVTEEAKKNLSKALKGKIKKKTPCIYCGKLVDGGNMKLHHGDRCKYKDNSTI